MSSIPTLSPVPFPPIPVLRWLGRVPYEPTWRAMQELNRTRTADTPDEIWFLEHDPVFTLGLNGRHEHVLAAGDIPVINTDRGGQVTYHGPGQLVVYPLLDLKRHEFTVRELVLWLENATIAAAARWGIEAAGRRDAPGVYVAGAKLASLGLRIRQGGSYHGLALNVALDLEPFQRINPCGYVGLQVTQLSTLGGPSDLKTVATVMAEELLAGLGLANGSGTAVRIDGL
jgi:lipoyl(octanoyl) transferase